MTFSYCFLRWRVVNKFRPFIDAYSGPFKDKFRFWFGLRLWVTILLFVVQGILQGSSTDILFILHIALILVFILFQVFLRPFRNYLIGICDTFFMLNYWLIIEMYFLFNSVFFGFYVGLTVAAILVVCLLVSLQLFIYIRKYFRDGYQAIPEAELNDTGIFEAAEGRH